MPPEEPERPFRYARDPAVLGAGIGADEVALLNTSRGKYYGLSGPGNRIWELLETPRTVDEICTALVNEFEVDRDRCERETRALIADLLAENLIVRSAAS